MKLHRNVVSGVISALSEILLGHKQADLVVGRMLQSNPNWGARDRHFIADNTYNITRYKRLYAYCCDVAPGNEADLWKMLGAKLIIDNIASHGERRAPPSGGSRTMTRVQSLDSAQDDTVPVQDSTFSLPAWPEFESLDVNALSEKNKEAQSIRKIRESIPDWLDELGEKELGTDWNAEIAALNQPAKLCIRINWLRNTANAVKTFLQEQNINFHETDLAPDALVIEGRKNLSGSAPYKNGWFEIQDVSSQCVAPFAEVEPGMTVIDGCAGAGGKTLHLGTLMQNTGDIIAFDVSEYKLDELKMRANRAGCHIIRTIHAEQLSEPLKTRYRAKADRLLLDVPCSGTGVLRRKPDAKWSLKPEFIEQITRTQAHILDNYAPFLKTGGLLIYSTCSILPGENERQVAAFITRNEGGFELVEQKRISPARSGFDGFYMAKLRRLI